MSYVTLFQTNFTQGEISPWMKARVDVAQYDNSCQSIKNFIVRPQGGTMKRPGTKYVAPIKTETDGNTRLIPFTYSDSDSYVIEAGNGYFRFYRNQAKVVSNADFVNGTFDSNITGWTDSSTGTGAIGWNATLGGVMAINGGAAGIGIARQSIAFMARNEYTLSATVSVGTINYKIGTSAGGTQIASGTLSVGSNNITFTPTTAGTVHFQFDSSTNANHYIDDISLDSPAYEINTPWTSAQLAQLKFAQVYDSIYFVHPDVKPYKLTRFDNDEWTLSTVVFEDGPYFDLTDSRYGGRGTGFTMTVSATSGSIVMTSSQALFTPSDVGRFIRYRTTGADAWGWAIITGYASSISVFATVQSTFSGTAASTQWRLGAWSDTTGWPSCITFYEQRMVLANTEYQQQTIWFSASADITNFSPDNAADKDAVDASTAMTYTIADNKANVIYWLEPLKGLYIGSSGGVWLARASNQSEALTPDNITISSIIKDSAKNSVPASVGSTILYPQKFGRKLLEVGYSFQDDAFKASDVALLAEHRTKGEIDEVAICRHPNYLIWVKKEDGSVSALTYVRDQGVVAWTEHTFGGTDSSVQSICAIPGTFEDELWLLISRTIDGVTRRYVEYLSQTFNEQEVEDAVFLDSAIPYSGPATNTLTGVDHLEGETVQCFGDGAQVVVVDAVDSGSVTLQDEVENAVVGLPYTSSILFNQPSIKNAPSQLQGRIGRIHAVVVRLYRSFGGRIGISTAQADIMPEYSSNTIMDGSIILRSEDREFPIPSGFSYNPSMYIEHSLPTPFNVLGASIQASISSK